MSWQTYADAELEKALYEDHEVAGFVVRILPKTEEDWDRLIILYKLLILVGLLFYAQLD